MKRNAATQAQVDAAHPGVSTWLSANAGSGKTRVLTDRVARLLLEGVNPQQILCLTYTKAAAFEMQNRLFARLGAWAMLGDGALSNELQALGVEGAPDLARARTLFARAIETPGGLKIQTIHAFCSSVLRRFPLEAQVSPDFSEIEDRAGELLRAEIVDQMAQDGLVTDMAGLFTGAEFGELTSELVRRADWFRRNPSRDDLLRALGQAPDVDPLQIAFTPAPGFMADVVTTLAASTKATDTKAANILTGADWQSPDHTLLHQCFAALLTQTATLVKALPTKESQDALGPLLQPFEDFKTRILDAHQAQLALTTTGNTETLWRFAQDFLRRYSDAKTLRGWLDFDDLIRKTRDLLADSARAQWVLYRLDGGIDHILVDEAQDTSPMQWEVIRALTTEITSGQGAHTDRPRTIFVVGDKKQSIYSFQGADPRAFDDMQAHFTAQFTEAAGQFFTRNLQFSFRSSAAILGLVDASFDGAVQAGFAPDQTHRAFKEALPGRVDLWPVIPKAEEEEDGPWYEPLDRKASTHHHVRLAQAVADQIREMLNTAMIPDGNTDHHLRPVRPGDIMILVQGRVSGPFTEIIRALKAANLPVAGADRLKVGAELAVRDILALLAFLDTPDDSLSLANALKSPLFGWSEQALYTLAHGRKAPQLWEALRQARDHHPETYEMLRDLRNLTDFLRPYDLIERILTRHQGRLRLIGRLGTEAEDGIDALLSQALAYERTEVPSLTGFLSWARADALEIKRQMDSAGDLIRVMTVHGAKGLEAPIVILPDCGPRRAGAGGRVVALDDVPIWKPAGKVIPSAVAEARAAEQEAQERERLRLLYVAMTRAEKWLIVAAAGDLGKTGNDWYSRVKAGLQMGDPVPLVTPAGEGLRAQFGDWETLPVQRPESPTPKTTEPTDLSGPVPMPERTQVMSPSGLGGAKALPGETGLDEDTAMARGTYIHRIIEAVLPVGNQQWAEICGSVPAENLPDTLINAARDEALAVVSDPGLAWMFAPGTLAEVTLSGHINGQLMRGAIDRLIIGDTITIVDFKTNTAVPDTPAQCPEGLLRQMGAYAALAAQIYPDRPINTGILWTATRHYMPLPHDLVSNALRATPDLDDPAPPS